MTNADPKTLEKEAYTFLAQERYEEAFKSFTRAADIYKGKANHQQAALCLASAASCWGLRSGEKTFYNAATSYESAAKEAEATGDLEYASMLYKYAAINYEKDMELASFSDMYYASKECYRRFLTLRLFWPSKIHPIMASNEQDGIRGTPRRLFQWIAFTLSFLLWGHGERPARAFFFGIFLIALCAFLYTQGNLLSHGVVFHPTIWQALYFSIVTFTTVGYGDITPIGFARVIVVFELFYGIFVMPLFIVGLSRKYLRI
jgi:tetratricopeptide (TPR) repeat protein